MPGIGIESEFSAPAPYPASLKANINPRPHPPRAFFKGLFSSIKYGCKMYFSYLRMQFCDVCTRIPWCSHPTSKRPCRPLSCGYSSFFERQRLEIGDQLFAIDGVPVLTADAGSEVAPPLEKARRLLNEAADRVITLRILPSPAEKAPYSVLFSSDADLGFALAQGGGGEIEPGAYPIVANVDALSSAYPLVRPPSPPRPPTPPTQPHATPPPPSPPHPPPLSARGGSRP